MKFLREPEEEQRNSLIRCAAGALLLAAVWAFTGILQIEAVYILVPLFLIPYLTVGYDVVWDALKGIIHFELLDERFLMFIATVGAFALGEYPEAVAVMLFYQIGELLQDVALDRSRDSIHSLMELKPDSARVLRGGEEVIVPPEEVSAGEIIIVLPGERIPLDGEIVEGDTALDKAALTGESLPQEALCGENVLSGSVNLTSLIKIKTCGVYGESTVAKILELAEHAEQNKARAESIVRRFAKIYTPAVVISAVLLAVIPALCGADLAVWLERALMFLVVSCPCALIISVPLSFFSGIGAASRAGILIKGANCMESLEKARAVIFDKTGTLTKGSFSVSAVHPSGISAADLLDIAACAESYSNHPIAGSIIRAHGGHIDASRISEVKEIAGMGIDSVIDGRHVLAGNGKLVGRENDDCEECRDRAGTVVHVSVDGEYCGHIVISDEIKPDSAQAVQALYRTGVQRVVMLTGDGPEVAQQTAQALGIKEFKHSLLPAGKAEAAGQIKAETEKGAVVFVGDGINDAPALATADVGIAMGISGSDAAIDTADAVLMDDSVTKIAKAIGISRTTMRIVRENIAFSLAVKLAIMVTGALGVTNMWWAVFGDVGVTLLAVINATRMLYSRKSK
ncbi:MAG: cadmium-translocating P-type ATPase [Clostridia bacterium]|nr:cadmium-translocating P-type ATPase [Clostridia bacterium]